VVGPEKVFFDESAGGLRRFFFVRLCFLVWLTSLSPVSFADTLTQAAGTALNPFRQDTCSHIGATSAVCNPNAGVASGQFHALITGNELRADAFADKYAGSGWESVSPSSAFGSALVTINDKLIFSGYSGPGTAWISFDFVYVLTSYLGSAPTVSTFHLVAGSNDYTTSTIPSNVVSNMEFVMPFVSGSIVPYLVSINLGASTEQGAAQLGVPGTDYWSHSVFTLYSYVTVHVQPRYYSEVIPSTTVIGSDPFNPGFALRQVNLPPLFTPEPRTSVLVFCGGVLLWFSRRIETIKG